MSAYLKNRVIWLQETVKVNRYFQQQRKWLLTTDETAVHGACPIPISSSIAEKRDLQKNEHLRSSNVFICIRKYRQGFHCCLK